MQRLRYENDEIVNSTGKFPNSFMLTTQRITTAIELKQIYDKFINFPSKFRSNNDLSDILYLVKNTNQIILIDPILVDHQFYYEIINILKDILKKWHKINLLTEFESFLFSIITQILSKINLNSTKLILSIKKCLKDIAKNGKYLDDKYNLKHFSKLISLYVQDEQITNSIVECLSSNYYIQMFKRSKIEKFILLKCPKYWIDYKGDHKEEMANKLLNTLLQSAGYLLQQNYLKQWPKSLTQLLDILNHSLTLCKSTIFDSNYLMEITDVLLSILNQKSLLKEHSSMLESSTALLLTLISNNEIILIHVKQKQEIIEKLISFENDNVQRILSIINNNEISSTVTQSLIISPEITDHRVPLRLPDSIFRTNENENKEDITLIWYDKNIGIRDDTIRTAKLLQEINDYVLICSNNETCLEYINQIKTEKIFLILSGISAKDILDDVHNKKQIDSIYIFCMISQNYQIYLNNQTYHKVIGIYTKHKPLLSAIQENMRYSMKQTEASGLFDKDQRSMKNLKRDLYEFNLFHAFKRVLLAGDYDRQVLKREMVSACRNYYRGNKIELKHIDEFEKTYKWEDSIHWYTKDCFIYRLVNKALRTEDYEALLTLRFFIIDLCENIEEKYQDLKEYQSKHGTPTFVSYRGLQLEPSEIYNLKHNIGKQISTNGYLSTSRSRDIAYAFSKKRTKRTDVESVMLEIDVSTLKWTSALADIAQFSKFPNEQEILFDLGATFTITNTNYDDKDKMWIVKLTLLTEEDLNQRILSFLDECSQTDTNMLLGELLFKTGQYDKCRKYFENLLNADENKFKNLAGIYYYIAFSYFAQEEYDKTIVNSIKACNEYLHLNNFKSAVQMMTNIGTCYANKNDKKNARIYFERAQHMYKDKVNSLDNNCTIGLIMNGLGSLEDNNETARQYYIKALNAYQNPLRTCYCTQTSHDYTSANICQRIARTYSNDGDDEKELEYFQKSENLRSIHIKSFSLSEREDYGWCLINIISIYRKRKDQIALDKYSKKFLEIMDNKVLELMCAQDKEAHRKILEDNWADTDQLFLDELLAYELKMLKLLETTSPTNYEKIIEAHIRIGSAYAKTQDANWARQHYAKALELCKLHIASKEKQAQLYYDIGNGFLKMDPDYALQVLYKSLEIRQTILSNDDPNIGFCYHCIAAAYQNKSLFDASIEHYKKAIEIYEKHLDKSDNQEKYQFDIKYCYETCQSSIASRYQVQKEYDKSTEYYLMAIKIVEKYFPDDFCSLTNYFKQIGFNYAEKCDYDLSISYYKKSLDIIEKHTNISSSLTCECNSHTPDHLLYIGNIYLKKNEYDLSIHYLEKAKNSLPDEHKNLSVCYHNIGISYESLKRYENAIDNYKQALVNYDKHLPNNLHDYIMCLNQISLCYSEMGTSQYQNAIDYALKTINISTKLCSENDKHDIALCYRNYCEILFKGGQYDNAINMANKSLEILIDEHNTEDIAVLYLLLSFNYYGKFENEKALQYVKMSMEIYEKQDSHLKNEITLTTYYMMALCLIRLHDYDKALMYGIKCQQAREQILPLEHYKRAYSHSLLALIYSKQGQYQKCEEQCLKVLEMLKQLVSNGDNNIGGLYDDIAEAYKDQNDMKNARKYYELCLKYFKIELIDNHPEIQRIQNIIHSLPRS